MAENGNKVLQNRYRIEKILGIGDRGAVYQVRDLNYPDANRKVAIKETMHHSDDARLREIALRMSQREANILAILNHPSIPTIHDFFSTEKKTYIVLDFIDGSDLETTLRNQENFQPVQQVVKWGIALCDVLSHLHTSEPPIVFRNIKPSNIMVDTQGHLWLIGFGLASHVDPRGGAGAIVGTEGFASPESYRGFVTPLSDIFGVGATLHHILTRHDPRLEPPFTFVERPIREFNPEVPPDLEAIVNRALALSPQDRFGSAADMKRHLEKLNPS